MTEGVCQICGEEIETADAVRCARCGTPHHRRCWAWTCGCSTYGCGSTRLQGEDVLPEVVKASLPHEATKGAKDGTTTGKERTAPWPVPSETPLEAAGPLAVALVISSLLAIMLSHLGWAAFEPPALHWWALFGLLFPVLLLIPPFRIFVDVEAGELVCRPALVLCHRDRRRIPFARVGFLSVSRDTRSIAPRMVPGSHFCAYKVVAVLADGETVDVSAGHASPVDAGFVGAKVAALVGCPFVSSREGQDLRPHRGDAGLEARFDDAPPWQAALITPAHVLAHLALSLGTVLLFLGTTVLPWFLLWLRMVRWLAEL